MKSNIFYLILLLFPHSYAFSQIFMEEEKLDWRKYENSYSKDYRLGEIKKINDDLMDYLETSDLLERNLNNFHFIDYNVDGDIDIVYSGDAGTETQRTLIFELREDSYVKTFDKFGNLIKLYSTIGGSAPPFSFLLKENACCGGFSVVYEAYQPVVNIGNGKLELQASTKYSSIAGTNFPTSFLDSPVLFEVKNELYHLRLNPVIDNETKNEELHINGNIIAEYTTGAKGYAVAKKQDNTGRVWWFVLMLNNNKALESIFDTGSNNENKYYSIGWMSSRYLKELQ